MGWQNQGIKVEFTKSYILTKLRIGFGIFGPETFINFNSSPNTMLFCHIFTLLEYIKGLVCLAVDKLCVDIPIVVEDDILFAHTIDEAIGNNRCLNWKGVI